MKIKKFNENAVIPKMVTGAAGAYDVVATEVLDEYNYVKCKLGFGLQIPSGYRVMIVPRSNLSATKWIIPNSPGLVDSDYINEIEVRFRYVGSERLPASFPYKVGDRVAQIFMEKVIPMEFEEVDELTATSERTGGFGSTGL